MFQVKCSGCSLNFEAPDESACKEFECPHCGAACKIPGKSQETAMEPAEKAGKPESPALTPCPACEKEISNYAEWCPGCGHKLTSGSGRSGEKGGFEVVVHLLEDIKEELKKISGEY